MSTLVNDEKTALEDLLHSCYSAIYAYGVVAAYLMDPDEALNAMASFRSHRDELLESIHELGYSAPPARAAYSLLSPINDELSARATAAMLEESAVAHWANAIYFLPKPTQNRECDFLQNCAVRSFRWSGIAKAFSSSS